MGSTRRLIWKNKGWKSAKECQGQYKKVVGSLGGSKEKVKPKDLFMLAVIGKQKRKENGMDAQTYLVSLMKTLSILGVHLNLVQILIMKANQHVAGLQFEPILNQDVLCC
ncbi:hypothetical protein RIF29_36787 [Crotalaria pallida]|uniref:Uncharacterized protein n=1 Tax=Crotalaria pallida TaxID=3830 RepID=A0AAN9EH23_CROPI